MDTKPIVLLYYACSKKGNNNIPKENKMKNTMKNTTKAKIIAGGLAVALLFVACDDKQKEEPPVVVEVTREFNDLTFWGKNIKLVDETGNAKDLKARGIWKQIQNGFDAVTIDPTDAVALKFIAICDTGNFAIVITSGADYPDGYAVDGYKILFRENQLSGFSAVELGDGIVSITYDMTLAKANSRDTVRMASVQVPQYNRAMQIRDNRIAGKMVRQRIG